METFLLGKSQPLPYLKVDPSGHQWFFILPGSDMLFGSHGMGQKQPWAVALLQRLASVPQSALFTLLKASSARILHGERAHLSQSGDNRPLFKESRQLGLHPSGC